MVRRVYDRVAARYDNDWSDIYSNSRACCIDQIVKHFGTDQKALEAVDFAVGTGNAFYDLRQHYELRNCTGFDVSGVMLSIAESKLSRDVKLINQDARRAGEYVKPESVNLVMSHFLLNFVQADQLFDNALKLLRPGGVFSIITSTQNSMSELFTGRFEKPANILGVRRSIRKMDTPRDHLQCLKTLQNSGFEIIDDHLLKQKVSFDSFIDVKRWAIDSGWMVSSLDKNLGLRLAFGRLMIGLYNIGMYPLYPVKATTEISIVLARKPERHTSLRFAA